MANRQKDDSRNEFKGMPIARALSAFLLVVLSIVGVLIVVVVHSSGNKLVEQTAQEFRTEKIRGVNGTIESFIQNRLEVLADHAASPYVTQSVMQPDANSGNLADFLGGLLLIGDQHKLSLLDFDGNLIHSTERWPAFDYSGDKFVAQLVEGNETQYAGLSEFDGKHFWRLAVPVSYHGLIEGVLVSEIPTDTIYHSSGFSAILAEGQVEFCKDGVAFATFGNDVDAKWSMVATQIPGLKVRYRTDTSAMTAGLTSIVMTLIYILTAMIAVAGVSAVFVGRRFFISPIASLRSATTSMTHGVKPAVGVKTFRVREFTQLHDDFENMFKAVCEREAELERARQELEERVATRTRELSVANRQLEEQSEHARAMAVKADSANLAKSEFLANMSHEIRTPMTAIIGFAQVLQELSDNPEVVQATETILRNGEHLLEIINDILDLSKIEAGEMQVEIIRADPIAIIRETVDIVACKAQEKSIALNVSYVNAIPSRVATDSTRLKQVLINLLGNAVKFTNEGSVTFEVQFVPCPAQPLLQFDVVDSGIGMSDEQVARLYRPFMQADSSMTRRFGGTGLGLAISKQIAELLSGDLVVVDSQEGVGTRMRLSVPTGPIGDVAMIKPTSISVTESGESTVVATEEQDDSHEVSGLRVLLAEDGVDNQRLLSHMLKRAGVSVVVACNGRAAVEAAWQDLVNGNPFAIVLMDMEMPIMNGYEATEELRSRGYKLPIVALTAHTDSAKRKACLDCGCNDFISKPISEHMLITALVEHAQFSQEQA